MRTKNLKNVVKPQWDLKLLITVVSLVCGLLGYVISGIVQGQRQIDNFATKPDLTEAFDRTVKHTESVREELKKSIDDKGAIVLREAFEHSDANRQALELKMEQMNTELRSSLAELRTTSGLTLRAVQDMRDAGYMPPKGVRRRDQQ